MSEQQEGGQQQVEYLEELINVWRTYKVVKGGRKPSFNAAVVVGNGKGKIGIGRGKAAEVPAAIQKALEQAKRSMRYIELNGNTLFAESFGRHGASKVFMRPASEGKGIIAGGAMRAVFKVLGVQDVLAKNIGSGNPLNVIRATLDGLTRIATPALIAEKRGKTVKEIME